MDSSQSSDTQLASDGKECNGGPTKKFKPRSSLCLLCKAFSAFCAVFDSLVFNDFFTDRSAVCCSGRASTNTPRL